MVIQSDKTGLVSGQLFVSFRLFYSEIILKWERHWIRTFRGLAGVTPYEIGQSFVDIALTNDAIVTCTHGTDTRVPIYSNAILFSAVGKDFLRSRLHSWRVSPCLRSHHLCIIFIEIQLALQQR
jgi:hypothetical protein